MLQCISYPDWVKCLIYFRFDAAVAFLQEHCPDTFNFATPIQFRLFLNWCSDNGVPMNIEEVGDFALGLPNVEECFPFDDVTPVYKTEGKMFLLASLTDVPLRINVKCEPDLAIDLRGQFPDHVLPGYHMSKAHWNTLVCDGRLTRTFITEQIARSYGLVGKKRKK
jgi:predicted DNA-binding protein (MmcQ/YjbR family)